LIALMTAVTLVNGCRREPYPPTTVSFDTIPSRPGRSTNRTRMNNLRPENLWKTTRRHAAKRRRHGHEDVRTAESLEERRSAAAGAAKEAERT
jgi:hypothetical protein